MARAIYNPMYMGCTMLSEKDLLSSSLISEIIFQPAKCVAPSAKSEVQRVIRRSEMVGIPSVVHIPHLLSREYCSALLAYVAARTTKNERRAGGIAVPLDGPTYRAFDDAAASSAQQTSFLLSNAIRPLDKILLRLCGLISGLRPDLKLRLAGAIIVGYYPVGHSFIDKHLDDCAATVNICLGSIGDGEEEHAMPAGDARGFLGGQLQVWDDSHGLEDATTFEQWPGSAILFSQSVVHSTVPVSKGDRYNLVVKYAYDGERDTEEKNTLDSMLKSWPEDPPVAFHEWSHLPNSLRQSVLSFLNVEELASAVITCKKEYELWRGPSGEVLYRRMLESNAQLASFVTLEQLARNVSETAKGKAKTSFGLLEDAVNEAAKSEPAQTLVPTRHLHRQLARNFIASQLLHQDLNLDQDAETLRSRAISFLEKYFTPGQGSYRQAYFYITLLHEWYQAEVKRLSRRHVRRRMRTGSFGAERATTGFFPLPRTGFFQQALMALTPSPPHTPHSPRTPPDPSCPQ